MTPSTTSSSLAGGLSLDEAAVLLDRILDEVCRAVVGKRDVIRLILSGLVADGHVLLDDVPGVAKTLTARSIAAAAGLDFSRVQFTPDVLPADITGSLVLDLATRTPEFRRGPVFTNLLLADEVNRAPAKTQAALLEAMQERQVTVDGEAQRLPQPFLVIATQNPIESEGTYPLPEAQLDRFLLRTTMGYPSEGDEVTLLAERLARGTDEVRLEAVCDPTTFSALQRSLEGIHVDPRLLGYCVALVRATRGSSQLVVGSSPRGTLALVKLARASALFARRDHVGPDDIRAMAVPALAHRVVLSDDAWARRTDPDDVVRRAVDSVPVPDLS
ncbi:MoxR family ATPase [Gemmatimonadota bacterium Y43]|uniref:AAA family ATPase n=1 Tax=Gaopeijia maritima TaxID=3119007 RepID=UPI003282AD27